MLGQLGPKAAYIPDMAVVLIDGSGNFFTPSDVVGAACRTLIIGSNRCPADPSDVMFFFFFWQEFSNKGGVETGWIGGFWRWGRFGGCNKCQMCLRMVETDSKWVLLLWGI